MPTVAPPFPVAKSPYVDLEIRELYRRIGTIEQILRTSAPSSAPGPASARIASVRAVYCSFISVRFDEGWVYAHPKLRRGPARYVLVLFPASLLLRVTAYISEVFARAAGDPANPFGRLMFADILPGEDPPPDYADYWGNIAKENMAAQYVGAPLPIDTRVRFPSDVIRYWYNVERNQPTGRKSLRRNVPDLPTLPVCVGFVFAEPAAGQAQVANGLEWSEEARGEVTVVPVWCDALEGNRITPDTPVGERPLIAVKPVKVGPR